MVSAWREPPNAKSAGVPDGMEAFACATTERQAFLSLGLDAVSAFSPLADVSLGNAKRPPWG